MPGTQRTRKSQMFKRLPKGENGGIQLLLIHNVEHLGKQGEIVEVKAGYALNYLLPQGLAAIATEHHKRMVDKHREKLRAIELAKLSEYQSLADELGRQSITIEANANDEGHLYGSVGPHEIVDGLKSAGFTLAQDQIRLEGPLKELGLYTIKVHLHSEVDASLKVWVVPTAAADDAASGSES
ncbi:MAG: 50S ribosomal protein L9 [Rubripirellula sp.]|nr:50S ribosomal protein L9 [Rubripirellula sp.]